MGFCPVLHSSRLVLLLMLTSAAAAAAAAVAVIIIDLASLATLVA